MTVSDFSLKLLLLFLPGLVSFILINELSIHKETKNIHWFVYSILWECKIVCVNRYCMNLLYAPYWGKQR